MRKCNGYIGADNLLSDDEWRSVCDYLLAIERAATLENIRYQALSGVSDLIGFETAAFYLASASRKTYDGCMIAQPVGHKVTARDFDACLSAAQTAVPSEGDLEKPAFSMVQISPSDEQSDEKAATGRALRLPECYQLVGFFSDAKGPTGAIALIRTPSQGCFTKRDTLVITAIAPHIAQKLASLAQSGSYHILQIDSLRDDYGLTRRELDVLQCMADGMPIHDIAEKLTISPATVKKHLEHIYRKVGVNDRMSLMRFAQQFFRT